MRKSFKATNIAISLGLLATLVGCDVGSEKAARPLDRFVKPLVWAACEGKEAPEAPFECATMKAPLDYKNIKGETIEIAMIRIPASEGKSKGVILTNPGGPGQSGFDSMVRDGENDVSKLGLYEFDYVSFDPRGVDRSFGLKCYTDEELDLTMMTDWTPDTPAEEKVIKAAEKIGEGCSSKFGETLKFFSTENTARDMDLMRESMGFKKIGYLGYSYGTYLGGVYATLFPDKVAAMVLDSAYDPAGDTPEEDALTQPVGFNDTYNRFGEWCNNNPKCTFTTSDFNADWLALEKKLDEESIETKDGRFVNHEVLNTATINSFYSDSYWPILAKALQDARNGKGAGLLALADEYNGRDKNGRYATSSNSQPIIDCASGIVSKGAKNPSEMLKTAKKKAPWYFRHAEPSRFEDGDCGKPFNDAQLISLNYSGKAPIVVIGGEKDPATPLRWATKMNKNLKGSVLVKYTGEGHASVGTNHCTSKVAANVLVNKKLPSVGKECGIDLPLPEPTWWASATRGISGTAHSKEVLDSLFGIDAVEMFLEYRSFVGNPDDAFTQLSKGLERNGFSHFEAGESDPTAGPQYFGSKEGILRAVFFSPQVLLEDGLTSELTGIPKGSTLVVLIFDLPEE